MKKLIIVAIAIIVAIILYNMETVKYDVDSVGTTVKVDEKWGNVRSSPTEGNNVISQVVFGESCTLTGYSRENIWTDGSAGAPAGSWVQVQLADGTVGWVAWRLVNGI